MQLTDLPTLDEYAHRTLSDPLEAIEDRIRVENLLMEERPPSAGVALYASHLAGSSVANGDQWYSRHTNFTVEEIEIDPAEVKAPWTFRPENDVNRLPTVDKRINLIRLEDARWPCNLSHLPFDRLVVELEAMCGTDAGKRAAAKDTLRRVMDAWNGERDFRPMFATTELEVEDILADTSADLGERLRNRLGLGHFSPATGSPIPVFIMRYPLQEAYTASPANGAPAVPTLLDGRLNDYFFPSPFPGHGAAPNPCLGHSLNLSPVTSESDYKLGVELLHPRFDYRAEHVFWWGYIANPVTMPLARARGFHLPWLRLYRDREDFGAGIVGAAP